MKPIRLWLAAVAESCSGEELALVLAIGLVLGTFPVFGCPTVLCLAASLVLRLNVVALQAVNQISSPLQIALLIPLTRIGMRIPLPAGASPLWKFGALAVQAVTGWFLVCVPLGFLLYAGLVYALRRSGPAAHARGSVSVGRLPV